MDIRCKKYKVGDWIVSDCNNVAYIESISDSKYNLQCKDGFHEKMSIEYIDRNWHLWSIQDAKDGDILFANIHKWDIWGDTSDLPLIVPTLLIYQEVKTDKDYIHSYCTLYDNHKFIKILYIYKTMFYNCDFNIRGIFPATKEQRDILFKKMHEAGYKWDADNKQLLSLKAEPTREMKGKFPPKWSKEDEEEFKIAIETLYEAGQHSSAMWLNSLKQRIVQ